MTGKPMLILAALLLALALPAQGEERLFMQTVRLSHQSADNIVTLMRGLLPAGAAIEGQGDTVVIRARKADLPSLVELVAQLDTPLHQFEIRVSTNPDVLRENLPAPPPPPPEAAQAEDDRIAIRKPADREPGIRTYRTRGRKLAPDTYTVQVLENRWATIRTGKAIPVASRQRNPDGTVTEVIEYRQLNSGLRLKPQLIGGKVLIAIVPFDESESRAGGGRLQQHGAATTVAVQPGEWIAIGAVSGSPRRIESGKVYGTRRAHPDDYDLFLRVDVIPGT